MDLDVAKLRNELQDLSQQRQQVIRQHLGALVLAWQHMRAGRFMHAPAHGAGQ